MCAGFHTAYPSRRITNIMDGSKGIQLQILLTNLAKAVRFMDLAGKPQSAEQLKRFACRRFGTRMYEQVDCYDLGFEIKQMVEERKPEERTVYALAEAKSKITAAVRGFRKMAAGLLMVADEIGFPLSSIEA